MSLRVILVAAQSLDGRITFHDAGGAAFASDADRSFFRTVLKEFDCSVMGGETFRVSEKAIRARKDDGRLQIVMSRRMDDPLPGVLEFTDAEPFEILASLRARGKKRCALLGGGQVYGAFLAAGLVDEVWVTVEPRIFGKGVPLSAQAVDVRLKLLGNEKLADDVLLLKYEVIR